MLFAFILFPLLLCGGAVTWFFGRQAIARNELDRRIEDLSQRGDPFDNESLQLFYEMSTSDDVSLLWVTLGETLESEVYVKSARDMPFHDAYEDDQPVVVPAPGEDWPNRKTVGQFLARWGSELETLHEIGIREYLRLGKPLRRPIRFASVATLLPDTQRARGMARLLQLQHAVAIYDGDQPLAFDCIRACLGVERSFDGEPLMISQLVAQAIGSLATDMIRTSLEHDLLSEQQMETIAADLPSFDSMIANYRMSIRGERAMFLPIFHDPSEVRAIMSGSTPIDASFLTKTRARDAIYYLDQLDKLLNVSTDTPSKFREGLSQFMAEFIAEREEAGMLTRNDRALTYNVLPDIESYGETYVQRHEMNNLAKLTIAVRTFQREFDRWPQALDELHKINVDPNGLTPANAQSFGYRIEQNGDARLWGIERSGQQVIPSEPPPIDGVENERNARWIWRLRP